VLSITWSLAISSAARGKRMEPGLMRSDIHHQPIGNGANEVPFPFFLPRLGRGGCGWRIGCFVRILADFVAWEGGKGEGKVKARSRKRSQVIVCTSLFGETGFGILPGCETHFAGATDYCGLGQSRRARVTELAVYLGLKP
jgi:hypothetical protein